MDAWQSALLTLLAAVRRDPLDAEMRAQLVRMLEQSPDGFQALAGADALRFGLLDESKLQRRIQFLHLLLQHGYLPPRVEAATGREWDGRPVIAVVPAYFYPHALSLLEAGGARDDIAVLVAGPSGPGYESLLELRRGPRGAEVLMHGALMLDQAGLVWRRFDAPVRAHYLLPIDNYYRDKFRLVREYDTSGVPMPGSAAIRAICEDKEQLAAIAGGIPGLRLPREIALKSGAPALERAALLDQLAIGGSDELVTKPVDAFGGQGVRFWDFFRQRGELLDYLRLHFASGGSTLVAQSRVRPPSTADGHEWNVRQYVLRCGDDDVRAPWKRVRVGRGVINTTRGASSCTVESLLSRLALVPAERAKLERALAGTDALAVEVLKRLEHYVPAGRFQTPDLLALDFMLAPDGDDYAVYLIEINDFASGGMRDYEVLAHRQALPNAPAIRADQPFSLAPAMLQSARWRALQYLRDNVTG